MQGRLFVVYVSCACPSFWTVIALGNKQQEGGFWCHHLSTRKPKTKMKQTNQLHCKTENVPPGVVKERKALLWVSTAPNLHLNFGIWRWNSHIRNGFQVRASTSSRGTKQENSLHAIHIGAPMAIATALSYLK
ncbi:hypothetical protein FA15DRAFT_696273 [Coprinopsis marcescibilis]|uniref:Uncharacterized protein n=1 Tax=Coprinopsis marcescibilis TaxID=230819 RepID=A0A5C3KMD3_COPMA|nr:hypothetical protein FA15DRAFT_696273 [Coprinopsis marcescibilis]